MNTIEMINKIGNMHRCLEDIQRYEKLLVNDIARSHTSMSISFVPQKEKDQIFDDLGVRIEMLGDYIEKSEILLEKIMKNMEDWKENAEEREDIKNEI